MRIRSADSFGAVARQQRRDLGLSQEVVAKRAGVTRQWLVRFERGSTDVTLSKVFAVLTELELVTRVDAAASVSERPPTLVIPTASVPELRVDHARLTQVRDAIRSLDERNTAGAAQ